MLKFKSMLAILAVALFAVSCSSNDDNDEKKVSLAQEVSGDYVGRMTALKMNLKQEKTYKIVASKNDPNMVQVVVPSYMLTELDNADFVKRLSNSESAKFPIPEIKIDNVLVQKNADGSYKLTVMKKMLDKKKKEHDYVMTAGPFEFTGDVLSLTISGKRMIMNFTCKPEPMPFAISTTFDGEKK